MNPKKNERLYSENFHIQQPTRKKTVNLNVQEVLFFCNEKKENTEIFKVSRGFLSRATTTKAARKKLMCVNRDAAAKRFSCLASPTFIHSVNSVIGQTRIRQK